MKRSGKVVIVGGGLSGLTAAIYLAKHGVKPILFEKSSYPKHKVCGEYISNEVIDYLRYLGLDVFSIGAVNINQVEVTTHDGKSIRSKLPLGGFGISRYLLDQKLAQLAINTGVDIIHDSVEDIKFVNDRFVVTAKSTAPIEAEFVLGAQGKRSLLDKRLKRPFIQQFSPWVGVKAHYNIDFPEHDIQLHNFEGGYCGMSKVENGVTNACYLVRHDVFKKYDGIQDFQEKVMSKNPRLADFFHRGEPVFEKSLAIAQINFGRKEVVQNHVLYCGDSAGMIYPLCGNGMAMAIHGGNVAAQWCLVYMRDNGTNRTSIENHYIAQWRKLFGRRLKAGRYIQHIFMKSSLAKASLKALKVMPGLMPTIIQQTHGKRIDIPTLINK